jgi:TetR/AcrR family transcriptional regulator, cholesterol catabolism regulator
VSPAKRDDIVAAVVSIVLEEGLSGAQLRAVATRAKVSLRTIYRYFPSRDEMILGAVECWMQDNSYARLAEPPQGASQYEVMMWGLRRIFEPWERSPQMLEAFYYARKASGGERLYQQGFSAMWPSTQTLSSGHDQAYADDLGMILRLLAFAAIAQFVDGHLEVTEILPLLDRAVFRLTSADSPASG